MAATKTIRLKRATIHVAADGFKPFEFGQIGQVVAGNYKIETIPPLTDVTLDAAEADRILAVYEGEVVATTAAAPAKSGASK